MKTTIKQYCEKNEISLEEFSIITGVPASTIYRIKSDRRANLSVNTIRKIHLGTKQRFGTPLELWEYIDLD